MKKVTIYGDKRPVSDEFYEKLDIFFESLRGILQLNLNTKNGVEVDISAMREYNNWYMVYKKEISDLPINIFLTDGLDFGFFPDTKIDWREVAKLMIQYGTTFNMALNNGDNAEDEYTLKLSYRNSKKDSTKYKS